MAPKLAIELLPPNLAIPPILIPEPTRAKLRTDNELPPVMKLMTESLLATRPKLRTDMLEPMCK
jgi:hypothetical protein